MKIIKYCNSQHHYKSSSHLQIGTLDYYRRHDNKFIADPKEGFGGPYSIKPIDDSKYLSQGFINQFGEGITVKGASDSTPIIRLEKGSTVNLNRKFICPNVYIFCCSITEEPSAETAKSLGYNSWYEIQNPQGFMREVQSGFPEVARLKHKGLGSAEVILMHDPVEYMNREGQELTEEFNLPLKLLFTKPKTSEVDSAISYEKNKEYRFVWLFINDANHQIIGVEEPPVLIRNTIRLKGHLR